MTYCCRFGSIRKVRNASILFCSSSLPIAPISELLSFSLSSMKQKNGRLSSTIHDVTIRQMTTAYSGVPSDGKLGIDEKLSWIPYRTTLPKSGIQVEVGPFNDTDWKNGMDLMNFIIREGKSWPFDKEFVSINDYRGYFLSHTAFVVRRIDCGRDNENGVSNESSFMGCFYIKPNYPGRCSHICNGGFITAPSYRQMGVATLMGRIFLLAAKDLGYRSSYFNLVFKSNTASVQLWESLGFERAAILEEAANLEGVEGLDTAYGYRYDLTKLPSHYLPK